MAERIKCLELGWEFPPYVAGGLGPACYGLSKAMARRTDLTLIVPRSDKAFKMRGVNIIGLNQFHFYEYHAVLETENKLPFPSMKIEVSFSNKDFNGFEARDLLMDQDLYGPNIMRKATVYAEIAAQVSHHLHFDIIHAHDWLTFLAATRIKNESGKPLLLHIHSLETDRANPEARNMVYEYERKAMETADRVLPVSFFTKQCIVNYYGIASEKIFPIHNGIRPVRKFRIKHTNDEKWVLFFGRITRQKGPEYLFETAAKLCGYMNNIRFYIAGTGDLLSRLQQRVNDAGISDKIIFTGHLKRAQLQQLLAQSDVYFMPSVSEPFGLSAVEAAQFDVPSVISKQSGVGEMLTHALRADFWDTDKLASYIYSLLHYEGLRKYIIEKTAEDLNSITWNNSADEVLKSYNVVLKRDQ